jgi:quinol monooxygenase YgiN
MASPTNVVTIHPYFKVDPGQMVAFKALLRAFCAKTAEEPLCLWYDFTISGDVIFCREAYIGAEGALNHIKNVGSLLDEAMKISQLLRLELHGPAAELDQMRPHLEGLNPLWFALECGMKKPEIA